MGWCWENARQLRPLLHLLLPLCVHSIAEEMIVSVLVDVTTNALCLGQKTCPQAIYISGLSRTVVGIFKMLLLRLLGHLAEEYGRTRKPLLILIVLTNIIPFILLAVDQSKGSVYAYYVLRTISYITSQGSIFCISVAYAADVLDDSNGLFSARENILARFLQNNDIFEADVEDDSSGITELFSASQVLGDVLARFLPKDYIFGVSIALLVFVPVYMTLFLTETYYFKSAFGFNKSQFSEILMVVRAGSFLSKILVLPLLNPMVGEKPILCAALLASIACGLLYGLAWASWVPHLSASFVVIYILVKPSITRAVKSIASNSEDWGNAREFVVGVQSIASLLSPLSMTPLTTWFLSSNAPFDYKGFSILFASISMVISLCFAWTLKLDAPSNTVSEDNTENIVEPPVLEDNTENIEEPLLS